MTTSHSHRHFRTRRPRHQNALLPGAFELPFACFYSYSPRGDTVVSRRSRLLCGRVKEGRSAWLKSYSLPVSLELNQNQSFGGFVSRGCVLVPVPESEPSSGRSRWVASRISSTLHELGLGREMWQGLQRLRPLARSTMAWRWERPTVEQHYQSLAVVARPDVPTDIVLVDDVVTKGRTLMAAALRLHQAYPGAAIRAFALIRTMGFVTDVNRLFDPCVGRILWDGRDARREP